MCESKLVELSGSAGHDVLFLSIVLRVLFLKLVLILICPRCPIILSMLRAMELPV